MEGNCGSLELSFWLSPDFKPDIIRLAEIQPIEGDKIDPQIFKKIQQGKNSEMFFAHQKVRNFGPKVSHL
jgi:hypothetical protein